jgi:hypothetical protein
MDALRRSIDDKGAGKEKPAKAPKKTEAASKPKRKAARG